tara:strand:+ start:188 stop:451 length:264 start_codon:yes stop_codon:yes gene_type:complete
MVKFNAHVRGMQKRLANTTKKTSKLQKLLQNPKTKKFLQAGAMAAEAGSRGSAGNIASKIIGFDDANTEDAAGKSVNGDSKPENTHY